MNIKCKLAVLPLVASLICAPVFAQNQTEPTVNPPTAQPMPAPSDAPQRLSDGAIAGIVVGSVAGTALLVGGICAILFVKVFGCCLKTGSKIAVEAVER